MMTGSTYQYPPVVVGGNMQTPGVQYPVNTSSAQYPVNTSGAQYPINTSGAQYPVNPQFAQGQAGGTNTSVQELQEQNRLLQEQIRLQQQQLQLQQQLQQQVGPGGMATPIDMAAPPSYDECVTDEAAMIRLQEHNLALQKQSQQQQLALEKKSPLSGSGLEPSAPPTWSSIVNLSCLSLANSHLHVPHLLLELKWIVLICRPSKMKTYYIRMVISSSVSPN